MNSVHEPGSRTMSKNRLWNNTESIRIENRPCAPSAQPVVSPRAQSPGRPRPAHLPHLLPLACLPRALQRRVVAWLDVSRPCVTTQSSSPLSLLSQYNFCIAIQIFPASLPVTIQYSLAIQLIPHLCNTTSVLQYNPCHSSPSKTTILQYNLAFLLQYTWD